MSLPLESAIYLLQQRTHLMKEVERLYLESCRADAALIAAYASAATKTCVDIGCGLGGVSAVLAEHNSYHFTMLDRDGNEGRKINYGDDFGKYNRLDLTSKFLKSRGVKHTTCNIDTQQPPQQVDLAFSILSWGFHYPIDVHIGWVAKAATQLIIDCRAGTDAKKSLQVRFKQVKLVSEKPKHEIYLCSQ